MLGMTGKSYSVEAIKASKPSSAASDSISPGVIFVSVRVVTSGTGAVISGATLAVDRVARKNRAGGRFRASSNPGRVNDVPHFPQFLAKATALLLIVPVPVPDPPDERVLFLSFLLLLGPATVAVETVCLSSPHALHHPV
jgi:hypothetical protein